MGGAGATAFVQNGARRAKRLRGAVRLGVEEPVEAEKDFGG